MFSRLQEIHCNAAVGSRRQADGYQVHILPVQQFFIILHHVTVQPVFLFLCLCLVRIYVCQRHNAAASGQLLICFYMYIGDIART